MMPNSNLADYADPILYDAENNEFEPAGSTLLKLALQVTGPVLDLGCGTGLMSIPLAQQGVEMVSVDVVPEMLAHGKKKAGDLPIRWVEGDVRAFQLQQKFELIFSTSAFRTSNGWPMSKKRKNGLHTTHRMDGRFGLVVSRNMIRCGR